MKVGDYVRTRWGCIAKFEGIHEKFYEFDSIIMDESSAVREELFVDIVEKSSPNIIDLIEVGDYVNGHRIEEISINKYDVKVLYYEIPSDYGYEEMLAKQIKSIITKEQFESMEYKVGDDNG